MKKLRPIRNQKRSYFFLIFCFSILSVSANTVNVGTQAKNIFTVNINIQDPGDTLEEVIKEIENATEYKFVFSSNIINLKKPVNVAPQKISVGDLLTEVARQTKFSFKQVNYSIIVKREKAVEVLQNGSISGSVHDENGLPLPGATIIIANITNLGTVSDYSGKFTLVNVPTGEYKLSVSYIGYNQTEQDVSVSPDNATHIDVKMSPGVIVGEEVLVLGDRLIGQAKALNQQRTNQNITNVVSADQIGRFPDANIGDAIKRIPGITIQNDQGEARDIIIRGLSPELNSVMINGERIPSAEGDNRRVQLDLIPSDMIQTIEVSKAVTPDMDADAIGGSVNLVTRVASEGLRLSGTLASGYNFLSEKPIWTGGLILGNRFFDNKLGVVLSGSYNDHKLGSDNIEAEWAEGDNGAYIENFEMREYQVQRVRRSISAALDYAINDNNSIYLKGIYNHRDDWENRFAVEYGDMGEPNEQGISFVEKINRETKGGLDSDRSKSARLEDQRVRNLTVGGDHLLGNKFKIDWSATYAKASEKRPNERYIAYEAAPEIEVDGEDEPQGMLFYQDISNPKKPAFRPAPSDGTSLSGSDPGLMDYSLYEFDALSEENQLTTETDWNARLDFSLPIGQSGIIKWGGRMRLKSKERSNNFNEYEFIDGSAESLADIPSRDVSNPDFLAGEMYQTGVFADNVWLGGLDLNNSGQFESEDKPDEYLPENYTAEENIFAAYAMADYQITEKLSLIAGLRFEQTNINYNGNELVLNEDGDIEGTSAITDKDSYSNLMPGIHFKYDFNENTILRLAWTNTLARPNYYDLVPYREVNFEDNEIFSGNPNLTPTTSMNFDMMAERYFNSIGILSGGVFYKDISDFIYVRQIDDYLDPLSGQTFDTFYQADNGGKASIFGFEFALQRQLDFLPGIMKGLGIYANYTYNHSTASGVTNEDGDDRGDLDLPGTADHLFNVSLSYETKKLVLRISVNYSSDYIDEVGGDEFEDRYYDKQTFLDINGSYAFTNQLRFFFEANNLTNQPLRYYQGIPERTMQAEYYNARFNAGLKFDLFKQK